MTKKKKTRKAKRKVKKKVVDNKVIDDDGPVTLSGFMSNYHKSFDICEKDGLHSGCENWDEGGGFVPEAVAEVLTRKNKLLEECLALFMSTKQESSKPEFKYLDFVIKELKKELGH